MLRHLYSGVYTWPEVHGTGDREYLWNSYAIQLVDRIILVDPLPLSEQVVHGIAASSSSSPPSSEQQTRGMQSHFTDAFEPGLEMSPEF